ncbi:hypothetical protein FBU30_004866 [Linnemannia zychae]|nr:hypothetical protein FBU30_004866 [Linnemannia zychae]
MDQSLANPKVFHERLNREEHLDGCSAGVSDDLLSNEDSIKYLSINISNDFLSSPQSLNLPQITGDLYLSQYQQPQLLQQQAQHAHSRSEQDPSTISILHILACQQQQQHHHQEEDAQALPMLQLSTLVKSQQNQQDSILLGQQQEQRTLLPMLPPQQLYYESTILNHLHPHLSSSLETTSNITHPVSTIETVTGSASVIPQQLYIDSLGQTSATYLDFSNFRSSTNDGRSSSDGCSSPGSESGYFDVPEDIYTSLHAASNTYSSPLDFKQPIAGCEYLMNSLEEFTISPLNISNVVDNLFFPLPGPSTDTTSDSVTVTPHSIFTPSIDSLEVTAVPTSLPTPAPQLNYASSLVITRTSRKSLAQQTTDPSLGHHPYSRSFSPAVNGSTSCSTVSMSSSFTSSVPALPSPLKKQFIGVFSDDEDDSDLANEEKENKTNPRRRKRVRKPASKAIIKPKGPPITLYCEYPGCKVTCSSYPSLMRHTEAHKWRGKYSPVRCEACQSALSNEFSVQRHITRSGEDSRCRRMRVYSVMKSETDVENTVRFYPNRPHGKKTIKVDLEKMRTKYY